MVRLVRAVLVCGFKHLLFSMSYMGCHCTTNQSGSYPHRWFHGHALRRAGQQQLPPSVAALETRNAEITAGREGLDHREPQHVVSGL